MGAVLIKVESMCLLAGITLGCWMRIVATHFHQVATVFAAELDFDAAVALTENAGGGLPVRARDTRSGDVRWHSRPPRPCSRERRPHHASAKGRISTLNDHEQRPCWATCHLPSAM